MKASIGVKQGPRWEKPEMEWRGKYGEERQEKGVRKTGQLCAVQS